MKDLSLYILDITMNAVQAGAGHIGIRLLEEENWLTLTVSDDGCGMTDEQVEKIADPFFTTRKTRGVGLGVPFLRMLAEQTGGSLKITSRNAEEYPENHGTTVTATFQIDHIDFIPLGDIGETMATLIQGSPHVHFVFEHIGQNFAVRLDTKELQQVLGAEVRLDNYEVLCWIREYIKEQYQSVNHQHVYKY